MITPHPRRSWAALCGRWLLVTTLAVVLMAPARADSPTGKVFRVPAGDAVETLRAFSEQSGVQLVFPFDQVRGTNTNPVFGTMTPRSALDQMVAHTELVVVEDDRTGALAVTRAKKTVLKFLRGDSMVAPVAVGATTTDETVHLPEFKVTTEKDLSYIGKEALGTTRTGVGLMDLPQSVVVLNRAFLNDVGPTILAKALNYVGGAQTGTINWSVDRYMMRGFVGEGDYVDGFRTQTDRNTDLNLIDHIEIIKGPSAIFIANQNNTVGGVINKISKSPTDYNVGTLTVEAGLWEANRADLDVGGPFRPGSKLMWRLLIAGQDAQGYYDKTYEKRTSILPMVGYRFNAETEGWIKFETFHSHYSSYNGIPLDGRTNQILNIPRNTNLNEDSPQNWRTDRFTRLWGQFTTRASEFFAVRVAAFDSYDTLRRVESVLHPSGAVGTTTPQYVIPPNFVQGQLVSRDTTAINSDFQPRREFQNDYVFTFSTGPAHHKLLVGIDWIDYPEKIKTYSSGAGSTAISSSIDPLNPVSPGFVSVNFDQPPTNISDKVQKFAKVYILETVDLLKDRLILSFGASRNRYSQASVSTAYNQITGELSAPVINPESVLYKNLVQYGVLVKPLPNVSVFYGFNKNFSSNGVQFGQFLPSQEGVQEELGIKSKWLDGLLNISMSYFSVTQLNNTVPAYPQTTPPSSVLVSGTVSRGFDGDFTFSVSKNWDIIGSFAFFRAHVPLAPPNNLIPQPYDGKRYQDIPVDNASEHNVSAWTRYKFTAAELKGFSIGVGVSYLARRAITDNSNQAFYGYVPGRTLVDTAFTYETKRFTYQLNVDNLFNKNYIYAARSNQVIIPGAPTNLRATITYKFW